MRQLEGKLVLITGGGRGIGLALGHRFAAAGCRVLLSDLDEAALVTARESFGGGADLRTYVLDVTDVDGIRAFRDRVHADVGPIDVLVNNAGIVFGGDFLDVPLEQHFLTYRVNVLGLVAVTQAFLPDLVGKPEAHLVNLASASGFIGLPFGSTYASSKWAVIGFSDSIRQELKLDGNGHVGVTTVCPSYVSTGLFEGARPPRTTRMLTPERLGDMIMRAIRRNRPYVLAPWLVKVTPMVKGALPTWLSDRIGRMFAADTSMRAWKGRGA
jgi:NAD(P)-dependent dehydrogenase (short-subunit alcohol dehydrogenase family)